MVEQTFESIQSALNAKASAKDVPILQRFFKTGVGQYAEGDQFIGVRVPQSRAIAKAHLDLPTSDINRLLDSPIHEHRQAALFIMVYRYLRASQIKSFSEEIRRDMSNVYLAALRRGRVNNWDLIDTSAEHLLGNYLIDRPRKLLFDLASSDQLWERRASIIATFAFIKRKDSSTTLDIAKELIHDREALIHKAVGWMLREVGKRCDQNILLTFLEEYAAAMPRQMLSYAIEHLSNQQKVYYRKLK